MRYSWCALSLPVVAFVVLATIPSTDASFIIDASSFETEKRDDHHAHHGITMDKLNETELTLHHAPIPASYYTLDWENDPQTEHQYPGLMFTHAVLMCLAFFVALPAGVLL